VQKGGPLSLGTPPSLQAPEGTWWHPGGTPPQPPLPSLAAFIAPKDQLFYSFLKPWLGEWVLGDGGTGGQHPWVPHGRSRGSRRRGRAAAEPRAEVGSAPAPVDARLPRGRPQVLRGHLQQDHPRHACEHPLPAPQGPPCTRTLPAPQPAPAAGA